MAGPILGRIFRLFGRIYCFLTDWAGEVDRSQAVPGVASTVEPVDGVDALLVATSVVRQTLIHQDCLK